MLNPSADRGCRSACTAIFPAPGCRMPVRPYSVQQAIGLQLLPDQVHDHPVIHPSIFLILLVRRITTPLFQKVIRASLTSPDRGRPARRSRVLIRSTFTSMPRKSTHIHNRSPGAVNIPHGAAHAAGLNRSLSYARWKSTSAGWWGNNPQAITIFSAVNSLDRAVNGTPAPSMLIHEVACPAEFHKVAP